MKPVILSCLLVALVLWCCGCTVVPTSDGRYAMVAGTKADAVAIADPHSGHVIFEAINLDQTDVPRYIRDMFGMDRLARVAIRQSDNDRIRSVTNTEAGVAKHQATEESGRHLQEQISRRAMIE